MNSLIMWQRFRRMLKGSKDLERDLVLKRKALEYEKMKDQRSNVRKALMKKSKARRSRRPKSSLMQKRELT